MNLNSIDLNILKHLACLLNELSVSGAAKKSNITQSAMSKSLKKIRESLDDEILVKTPQGYALTEFSKHIKPQVEKLLKDIDSLMNPCADFNPETEFATIKMVASDYANLVYLPALLEKIKTFPNMTLEIYSPQEQDLNKLQSEDVDFYMGIGQIGLLPENLIVKKIFSENLLSAVSSSHPLSSKPTPEDFCSYPHMLISNLNLNTGKINLIYTKGIVDLELEKMGLKRQVSLVIPNFTTAPLLLKDTNYILTAPSRLINYFKENANLRTFETPLNENPQSDFYLAWHPLALNKRVNIWFKNEIIDKVKI